MGFHDVIAADVVKYDEFLAYLSDPSKSIPSQEEMEKLYAKYSLDYLQGEEEMKKLAASMPPEYKPSQKRIERQSKVKNMNKTIFFAEMENQFNPVSRGLANIEKSNPIQRNQQALARYIYFYGTQKNQKALTDAAEEVTRTAAIHRKADAELKSAQKAIDLELTLRSKIDNLEKKLKRQRIEFASTEEPGTANPELTAILTKMSNLGPIMEEPEAEEYGDDSEKTQSDMDRETLRSLREQYAAAKQALPAAREKLAQAKIACSKAGKDHAEASLKFKETLFEMAPEEIRRAAAGIDEFNRELKNASNPEAMELKYRDIRLKTGMYAESEPIMKTFGNNFSPEEAESIRKTFGYVYGPQFRFMQEANFMAHPIRNYIDLEALQKVEPMALLEKVSDLSEKANKDTLRLKAQYTEHPEQGKVLLDDKYESSFFYNIHASRNQVISEWTSAISTYFGEEHASIHVVTQSGEIKTLDDKTFSELLESGEAFYAKIDKAKDEPALLCQPRPDGHLDVGNEIKNTRTSYEDMKPETPGLGARIWDSIISVIGGVLGKEWRVESVAQYEADLARYEYYSKCGRETARTQEQFDVLNSEANLKDKGAVLDNHLAEIEKQKQLEKEQKRVEELKARAEMGGRTVDEQDMLEAKNAVAKFQTERLHYERTQKVQAANIPEKQGKKLVDFWMKLDEMIASSEKLKDPTEKAATILTAFSYDRMIRNDLERLSNSHDGKLSPDLEKLMEFNNPINSLNRTINAMSEDPLLKLFINVVPKTEQEKAFKPKLDSEAAAHLLNMGKQYQAFKAVAEKKPELKNPVIEEKVIQTGKSELGGPSKS